jgi:hypothetical protein
MAPVFNFVKPMLVTHFDNSQLSSKIRRAREKFHLINASMEVNSSSFEKNKYNFDNNQHQSALYDLWIQLWGEKTGNAAVDCKGKKKRDESENEDTRRITCEEDQQEKGREDQPKSKKSIVKRKIGDAQISRELINQFRAERDTALKELKDAVQKMIKDNDSQVRAMLQGCIHQH